MSEIVEFLLARIEEDGERHVHDYDCDRLNVYGYGARMGDCDCSATKQLQAECEAKRRIVELHGRAFVCATYAHHGEVDSCSYCIDAEDCPTLRLLASIHADHSDFREEWKP